MRFVDEFRDPALVIAPLLIQGSVESLTDAAYLGVDARDSS